MWIKGVNIYTYLLKLESSAQTLKEESGGQGAKRGDFNVAGKLEKINSVKRGRKQWGMARFKYDWQQIQLEYGVQKQG